MDWNELDSDLPFERNESCWQDNWEVPEATKETCSIGPVLVLAPDEFDSFYRQYKTLLSACHEIGENQDGIPEYDLDVQMLDAGIINIYECRFLGCNLDFRRPIIIEHFGADQYEQTAMLTLSRSHLHIFLESGCYVVFLDDGPSAQNNYLIPPPYVQDIDRLYAEKIGGYLPWDFDWLEHIGFFYYSE